MEKVAVVRCEDYQEEQLRENLKRLFKLLGGIESFIKQDQQVLLKVNLLMDKPPEAAVTTNPYLVREVARLLKEAGARVIIGDSPGGPFNKRTLQKAYDAAGLTNIAEELNVELNYNLAHKEISFPEGEYNKSFVLGEFITEADVIINLPKLKTHGMTMYTGAVKNLFGAIPGLLKAEYHLKMPRVDLFSQMLIDLANCVKPALNIMDGITGMEGEGPSAGTPRQFGYLLASPSPLALDLAAIKLLGIKSPTKVPLIAAASKRGFSAKYESLHLLGDKLESARRVKIPEVEKASNLLDRRLPKSISNLLERILRPRPVFHHSKCVGCGDCYRSCPADTIVMKNKRPEVNLEGCIRCFCCQELCQYEAVEIKRPLLGKLLFRF